MSDINLPPMPMRWGWVQHFAGEDYPVLRGGYFPDCAPVYTGQQMREYATAAVLAEQRAREPVQAEPMPPAVEVPAAQRVNIQPKTGERITLGHINALLAPISISADGLRELGIEPAGRDKRAGLYSERQFAAICEAIAGRAISAKRAAVAIRLTKQADLDAAKGESNAT